MNSLAIILKQSKQIYIFILFLLCVGIAYGNSDKEKNKEVDTSVEKEEQVTLFAFSLSPPYIEEHIKNRFWNFGGDAFLSVNEYVRLAQAKHSQRGWLWSKSHLTAESWMVDIEFKIHGTTSLPGDGFAFWYTEDKENEGKVFGSQDKFKGLGVFYDTYMNGAHTHAFPFISAMVGDGEKEYDADNDGKKHEIGSCIESFRNKDWPTKTRIKYVKGRYLQVSMDVKGKEEWEVCFTVGNVTLPTAGFLGVTAHTGDVYDNHDIIRITTKSLIHPAVGENIKYEPYGHGYSNAEASGFSIFVTLMIIIVIVFGIIYWYSNRANNRYKRF